MKKGNLLKVLNLILGILIINQALTGALRERLSNATFEYLHKGGALLLVAGIVIHLIKNWTWVKAVYFSKKTGPKA